MTAFLPLPISTYHHHHHHQYHIPISFLSAFFSHLLSSSDLERTKILLQLGNVVLQVNKSLGNSELEFGGGLCTSNFGDLVRSHVGQKLRRKMQKKHGTFVRKTVFIRASGSHPLSFPSLPIPMSACVDGHVENAEVVSEFIHPSIRLLHHP